MVAALLLAAGESKRMQAAPKANLLLGNKTFLTAIIDVLRKAGIESISVILGKDAEKIQKKHPNLPVNFIINSDYRKGQLSSIKAGLKVIPDSTESLIVHLIDHPLIKSSTVKILIETRKNTKAPIVIPTFRNKRGHPVLFGCEVFSQLTEAPIDVGARAVVWKNADKLCEIETSDAGIIININRPEDYDKWCKNTGG